MNDDVGVLTFYSEKFGLLNDQIIKESSIAQLKEADSVSEMRYESNSHHLNDLLSDLEIVKSNIESLQFGQE